MCTGDKPVILLAVGNEIRKFVDGAKDHEYNDALITGRRIASLAVDSERRVAFWTDTSDNVIRRAMVPSDNKHRAYAQDLRVGIPSPHGIAFDWVTK